MVTPRRFGAVRCTATNSRGEQCKNTSIPGGNVCRYHGGAAPQVINAAERRFEEARARLAAEQVLGSAVVGCSPYEVLQDALDRAQQMVLFYRSKVIEVGLESPSKLVSGVTRIKSKEGAQEGLERTVETVPNVWLRLLGEAEKHVVWVASKMIEAGVSERRVMLAEEQGAILADVIERVLDRLSLSEEQRVLVGEVVPAELLAVAEEVG